MKRFLSALWRNRATLLVVATFVLAAGVLAFRQLPRSVFPDVTFPRVNVMATWGYAPPKLVLLRLTQPLERAAKSVPGVRLVRSETGNGLSKLHIYFSPGVSASQAYILLQARLASVSLPPGTHLTVRPMRPNVFPFAEYALVSNTISSSAMQPIFTFKARPALLNIPGVFTVDGIGRGPAQVDVRLNPVSLAQMHLTAEAVAQALSAHQGPYFSGRIEAFHQQFLLNTEGRPQTLAELRELPIPLPAHDAGTPHTVPLSALGEVSERAPPEIRGAAVVGWKHALLIDIAPQADVDITMVSTQVHTVVAHLRASLPPEVQLIKTYDFASLVQSSLGDVWIALLLGTVITLLVVVAFLRRLDLAVATLLVVPLSLAAALVVLKGAGLGLNIMTLGGLTAAIGALVDHAIVVTEHAAATDPTLPMAERRAAALRACADILPVMTFATLTSALLFLPLVFLSGTLGILFRQMAIALVVALIVSQAVALTITPMLAAWLVGRTQRARRTPPRLARRLRVAYDRLLGRALGRPILALPVALAITLLAGVALFTLPTAWLPAWDEGALAVPFRTPLGSSAADTIAAGRRMLEIAARNPAVESASVRAGQSLENPRADPNKGDLVILLKSNRPPVATVIGQLRSSFEHVIPDLAMLKLHQVLVNELGNLSGSHAPLEVELFGKSSNMLALWGERAAVALKKTHAFSEVTLKGGSTGPAFEVLPRQRAALVGITPVDIAHQLEEAYWGRTVGFMLRGEQILPLSVSVRADSAALNPLAFARHLWIQDPAGGSLPLASVAQVRFDDSVPYTDHQNLVPYTYIQLTPRSGLGLNQAASSARQTLAALHLPPEVTWQIGGYYRQQTKSFTQMTVILGSALVLLLAAVGFQLSSQRKAIAVLLGTTISAAGAAWALRLLGIPLDSTAFLGMLLVFAIVVNNGILIFGMARLRPAGCSPRLAMKLACRARARPILMTMAADVLGFLPLAFGIGHGTDLLKPLAVAVMGGLCLAVLVSLLLMPMLFLLLRPRAEGLVHDI
ncbi:MAG: efflux RND transporter permease subunit [Casimicrobiaceae bacterium]